MSGWQPAQLSSLIAASLNGALSFPALLGALAQAGVVAYRIDYSARQWRFYGAQDDTLDLPLALPDLPPVAPVWDVSALRAAILESQTQGQSFADFSARATRAGVQAYQVFLQGQRVLYQGRHGDTHLEWFPGAQAAHAGNV